MWLASSLNFMTDTFFPARADGGVRTAASALSLPN